MIATGSIPTKLPVQGAALPGVLTPDEILELEQIPRSLVVIGATTVGVETASIFAGLGTRVSLIEKGEAVLLGEDEEIQLGVKRTLETSNVAVVLNAPVESIKQVEGVLNVVCSGQSPKTFAAEVVLMATGRSADLEGLGVEKAGVKIHGGLIKVEEENSTNTTGVWAIGDCIRGMGWAHQAALEGRRVAEAILGVQSELDARFTPICYSTFPEVASVGLTLRKAQQQGIEAHVGRCNFAYNERSSIYGDEGGFVKIVVDTSSGQLLGAQIIGPHATEIINEIAVALRAGNTAEMLANTLHAHPTFSEVIPQAARNALLSL